jgi:hypothetical protein
MTEMIGLKWCARQNSNLRPLASESVRAVVAETPRSPPVVKKAINPAFFGEVVFLALPESTHLAGRLRTPNAPPAFRPGVRLEIRAWVQTACTAGSWGTGMPTTEAPQPKIADPRMTTVRAAPQNRGGRTSRPSREVTLLRVTSIQ